MQPCVNVFLGLETDPDIVARADINKNGSVNIIDVQRVVNVFLGRVENMRHLKRFLIIGLFLFHFACSAEAATCNVKDYGARGDGSTDDSQSIQNAIDDCYNQGGGTVLFPSGTYRADKIRIKSNVTLKLNGINMNDVVIKGTDDGFGPVVDATGRSNVGIEGPGTIDRGLGGSDADDPYQEDWEQDKTIVHMRDSTNVRIKDILITSEAYDTHYRGDHLVTSDCVNVTYDNVTIRANQERATNDSFHTTNGGKNINIINSAVYAGDDSMVFHGSAEWDPNGDGDSGYDEVLVQNVYIDGHCVQGGIMLTTAGIEGEPDSSRQTNMTFDNIYIEDALSEWGWGKGIAINPRGPNVKYENVTFSNITIRGDVPQPFEGIVYYRGGPGSDLHGCEGNHIVFRDIDVYRDRTSSDDQSIIQAMNDVTFENVTYIYPAGQSIPSTLIAFDKINGLCVNNFKIIKGGSEVSNPYNYLDWSGATNVTVGQACGGPLPPLEGDLNNDGTVNVIDVQLCVNVFLGLETNPDIIARADVNDDGSVNVIDVQRVVNVFLGG